MTDNVIELDQHCSMTSEQALGKALRHSFTDVVVIGDNTESLRVILSEMSSERLHWMLSKAAQAVLDES